MQTADDFPNHAISNPIDDGSAINKCGYSQTVWRQMTPSQKRRAYRKLSDSKIFAVHPEALRLRDREKERRKRQRNLERYRQRDKRRYRSNIERKRASSRASYYRPHSGLDFDPKERIGWIAAGGELLAAQLQPA